MFDLAARLVTAILLERFVTKARIGFDGERLVAVALKFLAECFMSSEDWTVRCIMPEKPRLIFTDRAYEHNEGLIGAVLFPAEGEPETFGMKLPGDLIEL